MPNPTPTPAAPKRPDPVTAERERIAEIHATARNFDLPDAMADAAIREGVALRDFQARVLDYLGQRDGGDTGAGATRAAMSGDFGGWSDQRRVRDEELERALVIELAVRVRIECPQAREHAAGSLLDSGTRRHGCVSSPLGAAKLRQRDSNCSRHKAP